MQEKIKELEKMLYNTLKSKEDLNKLYEKLLVHYSELNRSLLDLEKRMKRTTAITLDPVIQF